MLQNIRNLWLPINKKKKKLDKVRFGVELKALFIYQDNCMFFLTTENLLILAITSNLAKKWLLEMEWWQKDLNLIKQLTNFSFLHQEFPIPKL